MATRNKTYRKQTAFVLCTCSETAKKANHQHQTTYRYKEICCERIHCAAQETDIGMIVQQDVQTNCQERRTSTLKQKRIEPLSSHNMPYA